MIEEPLFIHIDYDKDRAWVAKTYFNCFNGSSFLEILECLFKRTGYGDEYTFCDLSENNEPDEEPFKGVKFGFNDDEVVLSLDEFESHIIEALGRYKSLNPEKAKDIELTKTKAIDFIAKWRLQEL